MATAKLPEDDDISDDLKTLEDLQITQKDLTSKQVTAIMGSLPNIPLEPPRGKSPKPLSQIDQLINSIKLLDEREEKAKEKSATATEFDKIRREISRQRMDLIREGQALSFMEFQKLHKQQRIQSKAQSKTSDDNYDVPEKELNKLTVDTLGEEKKSDYYRAIRAATSYRNHILELIDNIEGMIDSLNHCPDFEKEELIMEIKTENDTLKGLVQEYKKRSNEISFAGTSKDVEIAVKGLTNILSKSNKINSKIQYMEELEKKKLALCKSEQLEGLKITKFNGSGDNKFLQYYSFYTEFTELVMDKQYSDSTKLRYLKQYLEGEAKDIVKNYHSGAELATAFKALDEQYGRAEMVIRECIKSVQKLQPLRSETDIKASKNFLYKLTTNLSTLKVYNFDIESSVETFMLTIEEKLDRESSLKWEDEKAELKKEGEMITIEKFIDFFTEKIRKEENVSLVRSFASRGDFKPKAKIFQNKMKPSDGSRNKPFYKQNGKDNKLPQSSNYSMQKRFCIFCEKYGDHDSGFCKVKTFNQKFKEDKCMKHKACLCCLRTTDHMANNCPKRRLCMVCKKYHHFNLHSRQDLNSFYNKRNSAQSGQ